MPKGAPDSKELGHYLSLSQVGLEMVVPLCLGIALDYYFGWKPWATLAGVTFGFIGGLTHLIVLANRHAPADPSKSRGGAK